MSFSRKVFGLSLFISFIVTFLVISVLVAKTVMFVLRDGFQLITMPLGAVKYPDLGQDPFITISWQLVVLEYIILFISGLSYFLEMVFSRKNILLNRMEIVNSLDESILETLKKSTIAVIPAHDEEETIAEVVRKTLQHVREVIVVNDGSHDFTAEKAREAGAVVLNNPRKMGLCYTMLRGLKAATERDCQYVITLDADGQYLPDEIPLLLYPLHQNQAEVVLGSRLKGKIEYMPLTKRVGNWAFTRVLRKLSNLPISDGQTGFRAFKRETLLEIIPFHYVKHTYTQQQIIIMGTKKMIVKEVPITFQKRSHGPSRLISSPFQYALNGWQVIITSLIKNAPLRFFSFLGMFLICMSFPLLLYGTLVQFVLYQHSVFDSVLFGSLVGLTIGGISFIIIGFIMESRKDFFLP